MKFKDYVLEYLVNNSDPEWDVIRELDGCEEDFNASGEDNMQDWLESLIKDIEVIDEINYEYNYENNSDNYDLIFKSNGIYYSLSIEYSREYGIDTVFYDSLTQVEPVQKTITVYKLVESKEL